MSTIPQFDPLSSEVVSPFLAGMSEGLNKISTALNLTNAAVTDAAMSEVYIGEDDRYRIYQVAAGNRLWLSDPAPVIKKNGSVITAGTADFTIDYVGGAIIFESASRLTVSDTVTASVTRIASASTEINDIKTDVTALEAITAHFLGYYSTVSDLQTAHVTGSDGDFAIIGGTVDSIYMWDSTSSAWKDIYKTVDLSTYYTKTEADALLANKEGTITAHGSDASSDDYYWGGRKTWIALAGKVRAVVLTGIDTATSAIITASDTVLGALGKLQAQITGRPFLTLTGDPTTATVGTIGQRAVNESSGAVFRCTSTAGSVYTWVKQGSTDDIVASAITNAKLANMANNTIKGNVSGSSAAPSDLTVANVRSIITEGTSEVDAIADGDKVLIEDVSASAGSKTKHVLWSAIKTALRLVFAGITHASTHASDGSDPITPASIGALPDDAKLENLLIDGGFQYNPDGVSGTVVLTAGQYGHGMWKAGASGCTYTFSKTANKTTINISAGSLLQIVGGEDLQSDEVCLSWEGTAQGRIDSGSYGDSGLTGSATGGTDLTVEFGTGTIASAMLNYGIIPLPFPRLPYEDVLHQCQRLYWRGKGDGNCIAYLYAAAGNVQMFAGSISFPVTMRINPTLSVKTEPTNTNCTSYGIYPSIDGIAIYATVTAAGRFRVYDGEYAADARR